MPYILTEEEKEQFRQEYLANIRLINKYLPPEHRYREDLAGLNKRLNDPSEQRFYKLNMQLKAEQDKKMEISDLLFNKYKHLMDKDKPYPLPRLMHSEMIPSDDPEAMKINEERYKQYFLHPEAEVQRRIQRVLNSNASDLARIANCKDKENLLTEFYAQNQALVDDAFCVVGVLNDMKSKGVHLTPECEQFYNSIGQNFEIFSETSSNLSNINRSYFTMPNTQTAAQDRILNDMRVGFEEENPEVAKKLNSNVILKMNKDQIKDETKIHVANLKKKGVDLVNNGDALVKNVALYKGKEIPLSRWFREKLDSKPNPPTLKTLTDEEVKNVKKVFTVDYTKEAGYKAPEFNKFEKPIHEQLKANLALKYAIRADIKLADAEKESMSKAASVIAGGLKERMFNTTSKEYKNVITALKDYEKPNHVHEKDNRHLAFTANQYLIHKGVKTIEDAMRLPQPGRDRALLCLNIMDITQKDVNPELGKFVPGTNEVAKVNDAPVVKSLAIEDPKVLEEPEEKNNNIIEEKEPQKENIIDQELANG